MTGLIRRVALSEISRAVARVDPMTLSESGEIVEDVRIRGLEAVIHQSQRLGDIDGDQVLVYSRSDLERSLKDIDAETNDLLERVAKRIRRFATKQRDCLIDLDTPVEGGKAGHRWTPVNTVGAYAPAGRYPLPSSVLMTAVPARVAGVETVIVATPRPGPLTLAAAAVAGADSLIGVGGAQAIAALAFGTFGEACDLIVGPGNRWVTAAKKYLYGEVGIDGLAGPSEILVLADEDADPTLVAADLIAQAEHDPDAVPMLVAMGTRFVDDVELELSRQLTDLPASLVASQALSQGIAVVVESIQIAIDIANQLAPEHLALHVSDPDLALKSLHSYGSAFVGGRSAEAFADYGAGPNHVLPTAGSARFQSGLSVATFLKSPTWLNLDDPTPLVDDTVALARLEGLEGHARAAAVRATS